MEGSNGRRKSFPLRLPRTVWAQAIEFARFEGISLNQFIVQAIAEAITRLECSPSPTSLNTTVGNGRDSGQVSPPERLYAGSK